MTRRSSLLRPPVRPSRRLCRPGPVPGRRAGRGDRLDRTSRRRSARPWRCACACSTSGVDKYGLNAFIYDTTNDGAVNYDRVLFSRDQGRRRQGRRSRARASGPTSRSRSSAAPSTGKTAGMLVKVEELTADLSQVRLFHTSVSRANAVLARLGPARPGSPALRRVRRPEVPDLDRRPTSPSSRPASSARRPTPSRACTGRPATCRCSSTSSRPTSPTWRWSASRPPTSSSTSSSAWSPRSCRTAPRTRPTTTSTSTASPTAGSARGRASSAGPTRAPTRRCAWPSNLHGQASRPRSSAPTTASRRSSWPSTPARCWSTSACSPSRRRPTAGRPRARPSARPRPAGPAARSRST